MERAAHAVLDAAWDGGVRHFDAARSYGRAEAILAGWLRRAGGGRRISSSAPSGATATRPAGAWTPSITRSRSSPRRSCGASGASRRRCSASTSTSTRSTRRRSRAACSTTPTSRRSWRRCAPTGVRIGLSVTGPAQAATIDRALEVGGFDEVQATWNLHERSAGAALARAHDAGLEVYVKEALANGRLAARGAHPRAGGRGARARRERGPGRAGRCARAAVGGRRAQRRGDGRAAGEQPGRDCGRVGRALEEALAELEEPAEAYWAARSRWRGTRRRSSRGGARRCDGEHAGRVRVHTTLSRPASCGPADPAPQMPL